MSKWKARVKEGSPARGGKPPVGKAGRGPGGSRQQAGGMKEEVSKARELIKAKDFDAAIEAFEKILDRNPEAVPAYMGMGNAYAAKGEYETALEYYNGALHLKSEFAPALMMMGNVYLKMGQDDQAMERFERALKLKPDMERARTSLARLYSKTGRAQDAIDLLKKGIDQSPESEECRLLLAKEYLREGRRDDALKEVEAVVAQDPQSWRGYAELARIWEAKGEYEKSLHAIKASLRIKPDKEGRRLLACGRIYGKLGQFDSAMEVLDQVIEKGGKLLVPAKTEKAKALILKGQLDEAKDILSEVGKDGQMTPRVRLVMAEIMIREDRYDLAVAHYRAVLSSEKWKALERHPELKEAKNITGDDRDAALAYRQAFSAAEMIPFD